MPDIAEPGSLQEESTVADQLAEMSQDFYDLQLKRAKGRLTAMRSKYGSNKIFGYSVDDLIAIHDEAQEA